VIACDKHIEQVDRDGVKLAVALIIFLEITLFSLALGIMRQDMDCA